MTAIKKVPEQEIAYLQECWKSIKDNFPLNRNRLGFKCEAIVHKLKENGLDISVLEQGLTQEEFDKAACRAWVLQSLSCYHDAFALTNTTYLSDPAMRRYNTLGTLLKKFLPITEEYLKKVDDPSKIVSAFDFATFSFLRTAQQTGLLQTAYKSAAVDYAIEMTRIIYSYSNARNLNLSDCRKGFGYVKDALKAIENAEEYYAPQEIHAEYGIDVGFKPGKIEFSKEALERAKRFFFLKEISIEFEQAYKFHKNGHYVLDASGSGHGMMILPIQHIAQKLQASGFDLDSPETFKQFGTDFDTFWSCYETERTHAKKEKDSRTLLAPRPRKLKM